MEQSEWDALKVGDRVSVPDDGLVWYHGLHGMVTFVSSLAGRWIIVRWDNVDDENSSIRFYSPANLNREDPKSSIPLKTFVAFKVAELRAFQRYQEQGRIDAIEQGHPEDEWPLKQKQESWEEDFQSFSSSLPQS